MISKVKSIFRDNPALRIASIYSAFSALRILFSDQILLFSFRDPEILTRIQILKGWLHSAGMTGT